jgi:hypothetical protein
MALTSLSWILPVELTPDGLEVVTVHYDKAIAPQGSFQCYGVVVSGEADLACRITHVPKVVFAA